MQCIARGTGPRRIFFFSSFFCRYGSERAELDEQLRSLLDSEGNAADSGTYGRLLQACGKHRALAEGKRVHEKMIESGMGQNIYLANHLVSMYGKCGSLEEAQREFDRMHTRNVFSWTALMTAYAQHGRGSEALNLFKQMQQEDVQPDKITFTVALNACTSLGFLGDGKLVHSSVQASGLESDVVVGTALVDMYGKCGCVDEACAAFERIAHRNLVCWTSMIAAFAQNGHLDKAIHHFLQMQLEGLKPDRITFVTLLDACADPTVGKLLHELTIQSGLESDLDVGPVLVRMHGNCGSVDEALKVFERLPCRSSSIAAWNAMLAVYAQHGHGWKAYQLFKWMLFENIKPDAATFVAIFNACAGSGLREEATVIAACFEEDSELKPDGPVGSALVDMLIKCGMLPHAWRVFSKMQERTGDFGHAWNNMIGAFGHSHQAIQLFRRMQMEGVRADKLTYASVLHACAEVHALAEGKAVHEQIVCLGFEQDDLIKNALTSMYSSSTVNGFQSLGKLGSLENARA